MLEERLTCSPISATELVSSSVAAATVLTFSLALEDALATAVDFSLVSSIDLDMDFAEVSICVAADEIPSTSSPISFSKLSITEPKLASRACMESIALFMTLAEAAKSPGMPTGEIRRK